MQTDKVREGQIFYKGQDITLMQIWEMIDALADLIQSSPAKKLARDDEHLSYIYQALFDEWNKHNIVVHRKITRDMRSAIDSAMKDYSDEVIVQSIRNYAEILHGPQYYWSYKWTLTEFLSRHKGNNIERFIDLETAKSNFIGNSANNNKSAQKGKGVRPEIVGFADPYSLDAVNTYRSLLFRKVRKETGEDPNPEDIHQAVAKMVSERWPITKIQAAVFPNNEQK